MMWTFGPGDRVGELFLILLWLAFAALVVAVLVAALRWLWRTADRRDEGALPKAQVPRPDDPLEILRSRYARGEIDDEEYERRRKILGGP